MLAADLVGYVGFRSSGAEVRGNSAFDIALWDLFGKAMGQPSHSFWAASPTRDRTYNTCAGADYIKKATGQTTANYDLGGPDKNYDLDGFLRRADELALSLLKRASPRSRSGRSIWRPNRGGSIYPCPTYGRRWNHSKRSGRP